MGDRLDEMRERREECQADYDSAAMDYVHWLNEQTADEREAHWERVDRIKVEMALTDFWHERRWSSNG